MLYNYCYFLLEKLKGHFLQVNNYFKSSYKVEKKIF